MTDQKVTAEISVSLDGFITGPNDDVDNPLGDGGDRLHEWVYELAAWRGPHGLDGGKTNRDSEILDEAFQSGGATVMGKRMFDAGEEPWGNNPPFHMPVFVVTHEAREPVTKEGGTTFTFVTDGIASALGLARTAAGEKNVAIAGGANVIQQFIRAGLLDEIQIHLAPVMIGDGVRLFDQMGLDQLEFEIIRVVESDEVTHLKYRLKKKES